MRFILMWFDELFKCYFSYNRSYNLRRAGYFSGSSAPNMYICMFGIQNYWVFGLFPSSGILGTRKHNVSKTGSVSVLRCGWGEHTYSVVSLRQTNGPVMEVIIIIILILFFFSVLNVCVFKHFGSFDISFVT
jgi:hypothetical protein